MRKASERSYQVPFAQALISEGMRVLRVGHSSIEHGKDVIAVDSKGKVHAYQLKDGNLGLSEWEKVREQVVALVETPVEHPTLSDHPKHQPWLVVSGAASIPAVDRINGHNVSWKQRRYTPLKLMVGAELVTKFTRMAANFWPQLPEESRSLFGLYLADGTGNLDRNVFAKLLVSITTNAGKAKTEALRRLSAANLFASYALTPFYREENHWEIVQGWTIAAAHIAWSAEEAKLPLSAWKNTFEIARDEALKALEALAGEVLAEHSLVPKSVAELDCLTRTRNTICAGVVSVAVLFGRCRAQPFARSSEAKTLLEKLFVEGRLLFWGEAAAPFFLAMIWALETMRGDSFTDAILVGMVKTITMRNSPRLFWKFPQPHEAADDTQAKVLTRLLEEVPPLMEAAASYVLEPLVLMLASRLWKNSLAAQWSQISLVDLARLVADSPRDLLLWDWGQERGSHQSRMFDCPQSWQVLLAEARQDEDDKLPAILKDDTGFKLLYLLCFPHRLSRPFTKHLESFFRTL